MKKVRWLASVLSIVLVLISLAGCAGNGKADVEDTTSSTAKEQADSEKMTYNGQDVSEPVHLVLYYLGDAYPDQDKVLDKVNEILKEKINATLTLKNISLSDYATKYSLAIAGGEAFDLIYTSTWAYYQTEASKGAFAEVTDQVLADYMPLTKENQSPASFSQAKIDGKVYFIPCNMANVNGNAVLIRGDLREKYQLDKLKTIDDLAAYYTAVTADKDSGVSFAYDASQTNDTNKLVMYFAKNNYVQMAGSVQNYFTYQYNDSLSVDDVFWIYDTKEYLDYAKLMREWANNGYWSKSAIANATDVKEAFLNGTSASYFQNLGTLGATASQVLGTHPEWKPEIYDLTPDSDCFLAAYTGDGFAVLSNSKNQERAFMALDLMKFDEECYNLIRHGIKGEHYSKVDEGFWKPEASNENWPFGNALSWGIKNTMYELTREDTFPDQVDIGNAWKQRQIEGPTAAFSFDDTNVKNELSSLQSVYTQYIPLLDLGLVDDVEGAIAEFQQQAKAAGYEKVMSEAKTQLGEYLGK